MLRKPYHIALFLLTTVLVFSCKEKETEKGGDAATEEVEATHPTHSALQEALTFYASFDNGVDADFALGDARMYTVPNRQARDSAHAGMHKPDIRREDGQGKFGAGLVFTQRSPGYIYYPSERNMVYDTVNWSAAISFWLQLDPATDLEPGYCDPIQITDSGYNDAGIWVDFTKENPRDFRLGVIGDRDAWNPNPEGPDNENPIFNARLTGVKHPPFGRGEWTHVLINFSGLNTAQGEASLYLNGENQATRSDIDTPFTWDYPLSNIYLGLGYVGLFDELSIYNRNLSDEEIHSLYGLDEGVKMLLD